MTVRVYRSTDAGAPVLSGTAGSLIAVLDACLVNGYGTQVGSGWSKPFSGTNLAVYRPLGGSRLFLDVNDTTTTFATLDGYVTMTGVGVGSGPFPNPLVNGAEAVYVGKSQTANTTPRPWVIVATDTAVYIWTNVRSQSGTTDGYANMVFFGDITSYVPGDAFNTLIIGATATTAGDSTTPLFAGLGSPTSIIGGHFLARSWTQLGSSIACGKHSDEIRSTTNMGRGVLSFPNPIDNSIALTPVWVHEPTTPYFIRGVMPGLWNICHVAPFATGDTFFGDSSAQMTGKEFLVLSGCSSNSPPNQWAIEISNTW